LLFCKQRPEYCSEPCSEDRELSIGSEDIPIRPLQLTCYPGGGEEVFYRVGLEAVYLDEAFLDQALDENINGAQGYTDVLRQLALGCV